MRGNGTTDHGQYRAPNDVDFVSGCALLCKRATLERAGLLDERFFMYYEETEWCVRAGRLGFRIVHVPAAHLWHKIPLDARADQPYVAYYMTRNRLLFLRATGAAALTWLHAIVLQDLRTCVSLSLRRKWSARRSHRNAMVRAWGDFYDSGLVDGKRYRLRKRSYVATNNPHPVRSPQCTDYHSPPGDR